MSSSDGYDDQPTRRDGRPVPPPPGGADPTRRVGPADPDATRRVDPADPDATRRVDPAAGDPTRAEEPWEGTAHPDPTGGRSEAREAPGVVEEDEAAATEAERPRRGRDVALVLVGALLGFILAFLVVAWGTSDPDAGDGELDTAQQERIEALEAEVDERDARIGELESQLAEAEAAAGDRDADIEAQRQALDERTGALDDRAAALEERAAALDRREAELDQRAAALDQREAELDQGTTSDGTPTEEPGDGDPGTDGEGGNGGIDLPDLDTDEVETFIDRILERLRDLF